MDNKQLQWIEETIIQSANSAAFSAICKVHGLNEQAGLDALDSNQDFEAEFLKLRSWAIKNFPVEKFAKGIKALA